MAGLGDNNRGGLGTDAGRREHTYSPEGEISVAKLAVSGLEVLLGTVTVGLLDLAERASRHKTASAIGIATGLAVGKKVGAVAGLTAGLASVAGTTFVDCKLTKWFETDAFSDMSNADTI